MIDSVKGSVQHRDIQWLSIQQRRRAWRSAQSLAVSALLLGLTPTLSWAACSSYRGLASINELHRNGSSTRFAEVKILNPGLTAADYSGWTLSLCSSSTRCTTIPFSSADFSGYPWIDFPKSSISNANRINLTSSSGSDAILLDASGNTIDYLSVGSYTGQKDNSCTLYFATTAGTNSTNDTVYRDEDGTGNWALDTSGSHGTTEGQNNNIAGISGPTVTISDASASQGGTLAFTVTLSAAASSNIVINYQTLDDSATQGVDYQFTNGTLTIPAGQKTGTILVNSLDSGNGSSVRFLLQLVNANNASLAGQIGVGTVLAVTPTCFNDNFSSSLGSDWTTTYRSGSFGNPRVVSGRLRLTDATNNVATVASLQKLLPGDKNWVQVEFDHYAYGGTSNGSGADGIAVTLSDATITPQPGSFGGSLGYAQRDNGDNGFAGGWMGIALDEYGNFANPTEGRQGGVGLRKDSVTLRGSGSGSSGYNFIATSGTLSPGVDVGGSSAGPGYHYRITLDSRTSGQAELTVERKAGSTYSTLIGPLNMLAQSGQAAVPANFLLSLTGSTGGSVNIHELDNFQVCANKLNPIGVQIDHFEITHDGSALTCTPEAVTLKACLDASCSTLYTDPVSLTLSPSGWVGGDTQAMSGGTATFSLAHTTAGAVTLGVSSSSPTTKAFSSTLCRVGSSSATAANCSLLNFYDSGFAFDVLDTEANHPQSVQIKAVKKSDSTQQCVPAFANVSRSLNFWSTYVSPGPSGRVASRSVTVGASNTAISQNSASPTTLNLSFNGSGIATLDNFKYDDAGQMQLDAKYSGSSANGDAGLTMTGADLFVTRPAGLCVQSTASCAAGDATCSKFVVAGNSFPVSITAADWESATDTDFCTGNGNTPSYAQNGIALSTQLVAPSTGSVGSLSLSSYNHTASVNATTTINPWESEVGVFRIVATPPALGYFGYTVAAASSPNLGRFYPDHFVATLESPGSFAPFCTSAAPGFVYTGQPFAYASKPSLRITPYNSRGAVTTNYFGSFRKLAVGGITRTPPTISNNLGADHTTALPVTVSYQTAALSEAGGGAMLYDFSNADSYQFNKVDSLGNVIANALVAPFLSDIRISISAATDTDGVTTTVVPAAWTPVGVYPRYGRLLVDNAYGPETMDLAVPMHIEYYNGTDFVVNSDDSCTGFASTDLVPTFTSTRAGSGTFINGNASSANTIVLAKPGTPGTADLIFNASSWLQFDWKNDGKLHVPTATATFGQYRGNDRLIYWREVNQ